MGLGFLLDEDYLLPLTVLFLAVSIVALGFRASRRRGYAPFVMGLSASACIIAGRFVLHSDLVMYGGALLLLAASIWNAWPRGKPAGGRIRSFRRPAGADSRTAGIGKKEKETLK